MKRKRIFELVFGDKKSDSTKYTAVDDLIKAGRLEEDDGRLITWVQEGPAVKHSNREERNDIA